MDRPSAGSAVHGDDVDPETASSTRGPSALLPFPPTSTFNFAVPFPLHSRSRSSTRQAEELLHISQVALAEINSSSESSDAGDSLPESLNSENTAERSSGAAASTKESSNDVTPGEIVQSIEHSTTEESAEHSSAAEDTSRADSTLESSTAKTKSAADSFTKEGSTTENPSPTRSSAESNSPTPEVFHSASPSPKALICTSSSAQAQRFEATLLVREALFARNSKQHSNLLAEIASEAPATAHHFTVTVVLPEPSSTMAPRTTNQPQWAKDDKVLCFHGELLYEAKILASKLTVPSDANSPWEYNVHYKGWKASWDDWVGAERIRKLTEENKELARQLQREFATAHKSGSAAKSHNKKKGVSDDNSIASEDRQNSLPANSRKRGREDLEKEESFVARAGIKIPCPDVIKSMLVDDWEHVTKNLMLVTLPSKRPANEIIDDYAEQERLKHPQGSADADLLEEFVAGLRSYFANCLGKLLLYKFEREQYADVRKKWITVDGKGPGDYYGGEHLCRLIVTLPELIAQTNMDQQSVQRLREEIIKMTTWLGKNYNSYFSAAYEPASQEYIDKARSS